MSYLIRTKYSENHNWVTHAPTLTVANMSVSESRRTPKSVRSTFATRAGSEGNERGVIL